jgi:peptidoglycan hydrolase CwlO-like protein
MIKGLDIFNIMDIIKHEHFPEGGGIMRKLIVMLLFAVLIIGCGPKLAKKETMDALSEARAALESANAKISQLESEISNLQTTKDQLDQEIADLTKQVEELQNKIDTRCKK